ncbi:hypothetical protein Taro_003296, partial [Colocasia esculenta]|nr:hypothetical protein [Colocasia esculenta]
LTLWSLEDEKEELLDVKSKKEARTKGIFVFFTFSNPRISKRSKVRCRVAVVLGGIGVDANLRMMQVIGSPEGRFPTLFSIPLAPACCPIVPKASNSYLTFHVERQLDLSSVAARLREISEMADRRDWGGGGDDPEESTQRMIEIIWESLTDIRARMDQQAPVPLVAVPPGDGEAVPVAPVPPRVEVPFASPVPPPPPVLIAEEPVMQVEKFLRLQPPTYSGGPNPDTAEHWVHEIERVFATMRCPAADRVVLAAYQLRGFALEWWRLKMQTTFAGRTEEAITWPEFLDVFNDTFFPIQVQQVKRE